MFGSFVDLVKNWIIRGISDVSTYLNNTLVSIHSTVLLCNYNSLNKRDNTNDFYTILFMHIQYSMFQLYLDNGFI